MSLPQSDTPPPLGDLLARARRAWIAELSARLDVAGHPGYRRSDSAVLRLLARSPLGIGELADAIEISRQAARKLVTSLERRNLATIHHDPLDRRRVQVILTDTGHRYARAIAETIRVMNADLAHGATREQLAATTHVLRLLTAHSHPNAHSGPASTDRQG